jgi:hypothetical protein
LHEVPGEGSPALTETPASAAKNPPHYGFVPNAGALLGLIGILMAFGHSFLAMSGEESLAQVNRELEYPKHLNLMKAGMVIFVYSLLFTSLVSFFAYALIPDDVRPQYFNNLISGISIYLAGPMPLKLLFQAFIVIVGFLMLAGAINTSIIGSNGVLNRVSEDGVMTDWFRAPHRKFGTTYRMINLIVILQLVAIVGSRGNTHRWARRLAFASSGHSLQGIGDARLALQDKSHREEMRALSVCNSAAMKFRWALASLPSSCSLHRRHQPDHEAGRDGQQGWRSRSCSSWSSSSQSGSTTVNARLEARRDGSVSVAAPGRDFGETIDAASWQFSLCRARLQHTGPCQESARDDAHRQARSGRDDGAGDERAGCRIRRHQPEPAFHPL